jgi:hypothetical protein
MSDMIERAAQFRKKPVVITALQWTGENLDEVMAFCAGDASYELMARGNAELVISTLEDGEGTAQHVASRADWIIKGVKGEFYPCKPDIFAATYEPAALPAPPAQGEAVGRCKVPPGQTPLDDKLGHRLLDVISEGAVARDAGTGSPYHGHSLEHCLHATGWVQRDLRLALDAKTTPPDSAGELDALVAELRDGWVLEGEGVISASLGERAADAITALRAKGVR